MEINWGNKKGTREIKKVNLNPKDSCNKLQELRKKALRIDKTLSSRGLK